MNKRTVTYKNGLNNFPRGDLTTWDMNVFFGIVSAMKETGRRKRRFTFLELKKMSGTQKRTSLPKGLKGSGIAEYESLMNCSVKELKAKNSFLTDLIAMSKKLHDINFAACLGVPDHECKKDFRHFFSQFEVNGRELTLSVEIAEDFMPLLNFDSDKGEFTKFELDEFVSLKCIHSKTIYRLCKQWRSQGWFFIGIRELRTLLGMSERCTTDNITRGAIAPAMKELSGIFRGLEKEKFSNGNYGRVTSFKFTFQKERMKKASQTAPCNELTHSDMSYCDDAYF